MDGWDIVTSEDNMRCASFAETMAELYNALGERQAVQYLATPPTYRPASYYAFNEPKQLVNYYDQFFLSSQYHYSIWAGFMNPDKEPYMLTNGANIYLPVASMDITIDDIKEKLGVTSFYPTPERLDGSEFRKWAFQRKQILDLLKWIPIYYSGYAYTNRYTDRASTMYNNKRGGSYALNGNIPSWEQAEANFAALPWTVYPSLQKIQIAYGVYFFYDYGPQWGPHVPYETYFKEVPYVEGYIENKFRFSIPAKVEMYAKRTAGYSGVAANHGDLLIELDTWYKVKDLPDTETYNTVITYPGKEYYDLPGQPNPHSNPAGTVEGQLFCRYVCKFDGPNGFKYKNW